MRTSTPHPDADGGLHDDKGYALPSVITLRLLTIMMAIEETGSLSGAAKRLGMTQSAISQAVLAFEEAMGQAVFDRSLRPPVFTLTGRLILKHAAPILVLAQQLEHALRFSQHTQLPALRIGILDTFATTVGPFFMEAIRDIAASWSISSGPRETAITALLEHRADLVITSDDTLCPASLISRRVLSEPYFLVLPGNVEVGRDGLKELARKLDFIRYGQGRSITRQIEHYLQDNGVTPPQAYQFDTVDAVIGMVAAGLGWAITTPLALLKVRDQVKMLKCVPLPGPPMVRTISLVSHSGESAAIAEKIRVAIIGVLRDRTLPQIATLVPDLARDVRVGEDNR